MIHQTLCCCFELGTPIEQWIRYERVDKFMTENVARKSKLKWSQYFHSLRQIPTMVVPLELCRRGKNVGAKMTILFDSTKLKALYAKLSESRAYMSSSCVISESFILLQHQTAQVRTSEVLAISFSCTAVVKNEWWTSNHLHPVSLKIGAI